MVDATGQRQAEEIRQRLISIIESSQDAIVGKDLNGIIVSWNRGAEELFGYSTAEAVGLPITIIIPPDLLAEEIVILDRVRRGERVEPYETIRRAKDGRLIDVSLSISPIIDEQGNVIGASKIARDISARKRSEEKNQLLLREINHRVKNLFSITSGMLSLSARSAETPAELAATVRERLAALARAQDLTFPDLAGGSAAGKTAGLDTLIKTITAPFEYNTEGIARLESSGPQITLGSEAVTSLALLLHEFATNAAKYGALSTPAGRINISWSLQNEALSLTWAEQGGPPLETPSAPGAGFGSVLMDRIVRDQLGGEITRHWDQNGLTMQITLPLAALTR